MLGRYCTFAWFVLSRRYHADLLKLFRSAIGEQDLCYHFGRPNHHQSEYQIGSQCFGGPLRPGNHFFAISVELYVL